MERKEIEKACGQFDTPCYVFDLDILKNRVELIKEELGSEVSVCYAMKANPFVIKPMNDYICKYEVCSPGEYEICHRAGISSDKIVVSGVNKTNASMTRIMELCKGKGVFTLESPSHYEILSKVCREMNTTIRVLLRLSSGNQFGMDKETLENVLSMVINDPNMEPAGIHFYSGTQKKQKKIAKELSMLEEYGHYLNDRFGIKLEELEYGPGLSVTYFEADEPIDAVQELKGLRDLLGGITAFSHVTVEMGRFIATGCGYYFTSVMDVKKTDGVNYCIVDGGIHQLNYYGQIMGMKKPVMQLITESSAEEVPWNICGSLCTVNDVILKGAMFPELKAGDCFVFENCGAYSVTEGMALFLSRELPQIIFYSAKDGFLVARKPMETNLINSIMEEEE